MSKPSILVVEDEPLIADDISETLEAHGFHVCAIVDEAADALEAIQQYAPELALLDINIEGTVDGIELAEQLTIPFIFLTSYYDKATLARAGRTNPSGYLVKPYQDADLIANVELGLGKRHFQTFQKDWKPEKLFVKKEQEIISLMSDEIVYAEAFDNYTNLFTETDKFIISHTLKSVEEKLVPLGFVRVHRSFLINFRLIDSISENFVFLKGHKVAISKSHRKNLMDQLTLI